MHPNVSGRRSDYTPVRTAAAAVAPPANPAHVGSRFSAPAQPAQSLAPARRRLAGSWICRVCVALTAGGAAAWSAPPQYPFFELPKTPGTTSVFAQDMNESGQVAGWMGNANGTRAIRWDPGIGAVDLGAGIGACLNSSGSVGGRTSAPQEAALWTPTGQVIPLGTLGGTSIVQALNQAGSAVGSYGTGVNSRAFLWSDQNGNGQNDSGEMIGLGALSPGLASSAFDINPAGDLVVGESDVPGLPGHKAAVLFRDDNGNHAADPGEMRDLGSLGGFLSRAGGINRLNQVVGFSYLHDDLTRRAFRWEDADGDFAGDPGEMVDLGVPTGFTQSIALDINDRGLTVGIAIAANGSQVAALWTPEGAYDLNTLVTGMPVGARLTQASAINESGWITGHGTFPGGSQFAFLLMPEPTSAALLLIAALGVRRAHRA